MLGEMLERDAELDHLSGIDRMNGALQRRRRKNGRTDSIGNAAIANQVADPRILDAMQPHDLTRARR